MAGASAWVRARFPGETSGDRAAVTEALTRFAIAELRRDPDVSFRHLAAGHDLDAPLVVEGMRNPYDFARAFDPRRDWAVFLEHAGNDLPETAFERGLDVIDAYLVWLEGAGLLDAGRVRRYRFADHRPGLDEAVADLLAALPRPAAEPPVRPAFVHAEVPPLRVHVRKELLFGGDPAYLGQLQPATVFAVSSYPGFAPTFQILVADGAVFSFIPVHGLVDPTLRAGPELELADLVYHDCKSAEICVHAYAALAGDVLCYFKRRDLWLAGRYLFTVDWHTGNELLHLVALANGQYALLPHHKLKFGSGHAPGFAPYKKVRPEWKVGE